MRPDYQTEDGRVQLYQADALDVLPGLTPGSVDALITDPPYSSGGFTRSDKNADALDKYQQHGQIKQWRTFSGDNRDTRSFAYWCDLWLRLCLTTMHRGSYGMIFTDWRQLPTMTTAYQAAGLVWRGVIAWNKGRGSRAPHKGYFRHQCEYVIWGTLGPCKPAAHAGPFDGCMTHPNKHSDKHHLTGKPTPLMLDLVEAVPPRGLVLDPFAGSGTTGVAAVRTGRRFIGIERDPEYFAKMVERIEGAMLRPTEQRTNQPRTTKKPTAKTP